MEKSSAHVVVIGAVNLDIKGKSDKNLVPYTSNPGRVEISSGGVGRNIAENLARLNVNTTLISAFSNDYFSEILIRECKSAGINYEHSLFIDKYPTSLYLAILNHRGDLINAISDMSILSCITPDFLKTREEIMKTADIIVVDADVPHDSLDYILNLGNSSKIPVCVEPVSVEKARNLVPFMDRITLVTPNREEAEVLAGIEIESGAKGIVNVGDAILARGVKYAVITLGAEGVYLASKDVRRFISSISTVVEDATGAGDSLVAGMIYGLSLDKSIYDSIRMGISVATLTLTTAKTVHPSLSEEMLEQIFKKSW